MKVYTRKGDDGSTGLADGSRVPKSLARVAAYGDVDELNASLAVLLAEGLPEDAAAPLLDAQSLLFSVGAFLADPSGRHDLPEEAVRPAWLEEWVDRMEEDLPQLRNFILPGGTRASALAHQARTVCRRAERSVVALSGAGDQAIPLLNRLSDALFVLARWLNVRAGVADAVWKPS